MGEIDDIIVKISPFYKKKKGPSMHYNLVYDSSSETLEPVYFYLLDLMNKMFGNKVEKIIDNFASSPGSGHFSELQGKASQMQQEASRVLGTVNNILKGVLNIIYDLKEFKIRLSHYDAAKSKDDNVKEAGILALKQIWMDRVDLAQRGQGSLNALSSGNLQFVTLRDAFMVVKSVNDVDKLDLNDRVKRILKPRVQEFFEWLKRSEQELRKRYEIEKIYLKSQVQALKLNARWAKPYLKAASQLTANEKLARDAGLVTIFNTILLQLTLIGKNELEVKDAILSKRIPKAFKKIKGLRKYYSVVFVDFTFRGIPSKMGQHYTFGGRAEVNFKAYSLNEEELLLLEEKLGDTDLDSALKLVSGMTDDSLLQLKADIDEILSEKEETQEKKEENTNPFSALFSSLSFKSEKKDEKDEKKEKLEKIKKKGIRTENYAEQYLRSVSEADAKNSCFDVYDIYKKGHGMATFPYATESEGRAPRSSAEKFFGFSQPVR